MKIDLHAHILPGSWPNLSERYGYGGFIQLEMDPNDPGKAHMMRDGKLFRTVERDCWSLDCRLRAMNAADVDVQVLSTVPVMFNYWAKPEHGLDLAQLLNQHIADCVAEHPTRFVGLGMLPMQDPELAAGELVRSVNELGLAGAQIGTNFDGKNLDDPYFEPVFAAAEETGACLFIHPWDMLGADRMQRHWLKWLVGMPSESALAVASVLLGGVLDKHPNLKLCFAHGGGAFPGILGRIEKGFFARPDLCQTATQTPPRELVSKLYFDTMTHDLNMLRHLVEVVGVDRVALGTDAPFPLGEAHPGAMIEGTDHFTVTEKERLLSGTSIELLGLDRAAYETDASRAHSAGLTGRDA